MRQNLVCSLLSNVRSGDCAEKYCNEVKSVVIYTGSDNDWTAPNFEAP